MEILDFYRSGLMDRNEQRSFLLVDTGKLFLHWRWEVDYEV